MENRKFKLVFLVLTLFLVSFSKSFGYAVETHAFLTKAVVQFYNQNFSDKKISDDLALYLIDGARLEDNAPRFMHHFYDPVNNRGLSDLGFTGYASKDWAQDPKKQTAILYRILPQTEASLLSATQLDKIRPVFRQTDFTWQKAIELYAKGETEQALFALGHIVHLIEDAAVPDHTRNDAHPPYDDGGSPYENWTGKFNLENPDKDLAGRLKSKKPMTLGDINEYFDAMAKYSNNNFYSRDSIKNYDLPKPDFFEKEGGLVYGFYRDEFGKSYHLAAYSDLDDFNYLSDAVDARPLLKEEVGELRVLPDYWSRLSTKAVQYGAGVVNLFFQEATAAKEKYTTESVQRPWLATVMSGLASIFGGGEKKDVADYVIELRDGGSEPSVIASEAKQSYDSVNVRSPRPDSEIGTRDDKQEEIGVIVGEFVALTNEDKTQAVKVSTGADFNTGEARTEVDYTVCKFEEIGTGEILRSAQNDIGVRINEVAWMGGEVSASDEWIELKYNGGAEIDITGWWLIDKDESVKVRLNGKITADRNNVGAFYLLERTNDDSVPGVAADQIFTGALGNVGEGLRLLNKDCQLVDEVWAAPDWPAGDNNFKYTMERGLDLLWRNFDGSPLATLGVKIFGTPKAENSAGAIPISYSGGGAAPVPAPVPSPVILNGSEGSPGDSSAPPQNDSGGTTSLLKILINEIQTGTTAGGSEDEYVELYNPNDQEVDLAGYALKKKTSTGTESNLVSSAAFTGKIPAKGLFVVTHPSYTGTKVSNLQYSAASNNLAYTNNSVVLYDATGSVSDEVAYTEIPKDALWKREGGLILAALGGELATTTVEVIATTTEEIAAASSTPEVATTTPPGISSTAFSHDEGGNFLSFTLNDTHLDSADIMIHHIIVWFNQDPKEMWNPANRGGDLQSNWARWCPSTDIVGDKLDIGSGTGFHNYVMPGYATATRPAVYDTTKEAYYYRVYFTATCPSGGFANSIDLKTATSTGNFVTMGLWYYNTQMGIIDEVNSVNYPERVYFASQEF